MSVDRPCDDDNPDGTEPESFGVEPIGYGQLFGVSKASVRHREHSLSQRVVCRLLRIGAAAGELA